MSQNKTLLGKLNDSARTFARDDEAATAVEYALMASLIALAVILTVTRLGQKVKTIFTNVDTGLKTEAG